MTSNHLFIPTRIVFFFTSGALNQFITAVEIKRYAHSDHDCIPLEIDFDKVHRGPGYWHFNSDLLTNVVFQAKIEQFWTGWQEEFENFPDPLKWWDKGKQKFYYSHQAVIETLYACAHTLCAYCFRGIMGLNKPCAFAECIITDQVLWIKCC